MQKYWEMPSFEKLYLEDSWVLNITASPGSVLLELDFVLQEGHALYFEPKQNEQYCYRKGVIVFNMVENLNWEDQLATPAIDANEEVDYGSIDAFSIEGDVYKLIGDFGSIKIVSSAIPTVSLK